MGCLIFALNITFRENIVEGLLYLEYQSVCPFVRIGSPRSLSP